MESKFGLVGGLSEGLLFGLSYGVSFLIVRATSRWLLYRAGHIPWKLVFLLDYCTYHNFLRYVGGGYIFVHRMLKEHFAEMDDERIQTVAPRAAER